jgi:hypothetical protein
MVQEKKMRLCSYVKRLQLIVESSIKDPLRPSSMWIHRDNKHGPKKTVHMHVAHFANGSRNPRVKV